MFEKYSFEMDENLLAKAIAKSERQTLRDKMKDWDKELSEEKEEVITLNPNNKEIKTISLVSYIKYAVAACVVVGISFWFYKSQNEIDLPVNPVVTQPNEKDSSLQLPKPILVESSTNSKLTDVLMDEGMGYSNSNSKIKLVSISNSDRIISIQNAIDEYQKFIEKELLTSPGAGEKNKNLIIQLENEINSLEKELTELQSKQNSYLFDGKTLTLYDISPNAITVLAFDNNYYVKKKNDFYTLIVANEPQKYSKVSDSTLKVNLEEILYRNGKFN
jgi:hypothetical protein